MATKKALIGMSGGVDSAGAALLLQDMGHEVSGVTLVLQDCKDPAPDIADARAAAERLGIPHHVLDLRERFAGQVMDRFVAEYAAGRTPNPCIDCNREIKFGAMLDWALTQGRTPSPPGTTPGWPSTERPAAGSCCVAGIAARIRPTSSTS